MTAPSDGIVFRLAEEADIPAVIELMRSSLGEGRIPRTREFWEWKHRQNPFGPSPMWLATAGSEVVGVRLFLRWTFVHQGRHVTAARAVDTATSPEFQGKGIFKKLTLSLLEQVKEEGVAFIFNTPNQKSRPGYLKMGWRAHGRAPLWFRARRPLAMAERLLQRGSPSEPETEVASADPQLDLTLRLAMAAGLLDQPPRSAGYQTRISYGYLLWRYARCPAAHYRATSENPAESLVVTRLRRRNGLTELALSDLVFRRSREGLASVIRSIQSALRGDPSDYAIAAVRPSPWEAAALTACGFVPIPAAGPIVTVRDLAKTAPPAASYRSGLHASIGDLELF